VFAEYTIASGNKMTQKVLIGNAYNNAGDLNVYSYQFAHNGKELTLTRNGQTFIPWLRK